MTSESPHPSTSPDMPQPTELDSGLVESYFFNDFIPNKRDFIYGFSDNSFDVFVVHGC